MEGYINSWAWGLISADRADLATELFLYNIELYPNRATVYQNYGYYLQNTSSNKKALEQFKKSLEIVPDENVSEIVKELELSLREAK